jgi:zinc protease
VLFNRNPLAQVPIPKPKDFDAINSDRALDIYRSEFMNADGYHFFLVGNVQPETALPLIEKYLGSLPTAGKLPSFKDNGVRPINGHTKLDIHKGKEKQSMIVALYHGDITYTEDFSLKAQAVAELLNIKVIEQLREKLGGIYTGGFYADVSREPYAHYNVMMQLPCGPENVDKLLAAAIAEIRAIQDKGVELKDLDKVKSQWREKYRVDVKENK